MADGERPLPSSADDVNLDDAHAQPPLVVAAADEPLVIAAADEDIDASLPADSAAASDHDAASLSILALQHRVALLKARTLQHQQVIAEMRRREQELEVSILRRQLAQLREQVSDRCDMFPATLTHASNVTQGRPAVAAAPPLQPRVRARNVREPSDGDAHCAGIR